MAYLLKEEVDLVPPNRQQRRGIENYRPPIRDIVHYSIPRSIIDWQVQSEAMYRQYVLNKEINEDKVLLVRSWLKVFHVLYKMAIRMEKEKNSTNEGYQVLIWYSY